MKIYFTVVFLTVFTVSIVSAQEDCSTVQKENEKIISALKEDKIQLNKEVQYYKEVLDLLNKEATAENEDFVFRLTSVKGKLDQRQLHVELLLENVGAVGKFQTRNVELIDSKGNILKTYNIRFGGEQKFIERFQPEIPVKMNISFEDISDIPVIKALVINFYNRKYGRPVDVIFKNLEVKWE